MKLYHGSNMVVRSPRIISLDRKLDLGTGFYLTSSYQQAEKRAQITTTRRKTGTATVTVFDFDESAIKTLNVLIFDGIDRDWLRYSLRNRNAENMVDDDFDIVIGPAAPVADDKTRFVIIAYLTNIYNEDEAIKRLLPQKLEYLYTFKTDAALKYLRFREMNNTWTLSCPSF